MSVRARRPPDGSPDRRNRGAVAVSRRTVPTLRDVRLSGKYLLPNYSHYRRRAIANALFGTGGGCWDADWPDTQTPRLPSQLIKASGNALCRHFLKMLSCN